MNPIVIPFDPVAMRIGPFVLAWHGAFSALSILAGLYLAVWLAPAAGVAVAPVDAGAP